MWGPFKGHLEFRFPELDIASPRVVLEKRKGIRIWLKPKGLDKHAASCLFLHGSALQSPPCSPSLAEVPCHLTAAGKPLTPSSSGNLQSKAPRGVRTVGRVWPSVHKNMRCFTLAISLLLTDATSTSLHLILAMLWALYLLIQPLCDDALYPSFYLKF